MRELVLLLCSPLCVAALSWAAFAACLDAPGDRAPAVARLVVAWDPLGCGEPHRVAVELDDEAGLRVSASTPCHLGALSVDVEHTGAYHGRIYAWAIARPAHAGMPIDVIIDQPVVRRDVATPPWP